MSRPFISIVVPVYNVAGVLARCVDSILAQTFDDFELLLVDDGSTDGSGALCDGYARSCHGKVRVIHKSNGGVSDARNAGIDAACGEWLCFIDSDDFIDPSYLEDFGFGRDGFEMFLQGYRRIEKGERVSVRKFDNTLKMSFVEILSQAELKTIYNSPYSKLFKAEKINKAGLRFSRHTSFGEDHLFALEYATLVDSIAISETAGYNYTIGNACSLAHKVVDNKEMLFYLNQSDKLFTVIAERPANERLSVVYDIIRARNINRAVKNFFRGEGTYEEYCRFVRLLPGNLLKISRVAESFWGRICCLLLNICPMKLSYLVFRSLL